MRKIKYLGEKYRKLAIEEALGNITLIPCKKCGAPVQDGYVCHHCGCESPNDGNDYDMWDLMP